RAELAGGEDRLDVRVAARFAEGTQLVVQRLPVTEQHVATRDDDVDLAGAGGDRLADLLEPGRHGRQAGREAGGHRRDGDARALKRPDRSRYHLVIDADGGNAQTCVSHAELLEQVVPHRGAGFGAQPADPARGVI